MSSSRSTRKRQTRLSFQPVASSSPEASKLSASLRPRAAVVRFEQGGTSRKKRRLRIEDSINGQNELDQASSPVLTRHPDDFVRSSGRGRKYDDGNNGGLLEPAQSSEVQTRARKRRGSQTTSSSSEDSSSGMSSKRPPFLGKDKTPMSQRRDVNQNATDIFQYTPTRKAASPPSIRTPSRRVSRTLHSLFRTPTRRKSPESSDSAEDTIVVGGSHEEDERDDVPLPTQRTRRASQAVVISSEEDRTTEAGSDSADSDDIIHISSQRRSTRSTRQKATPRETRSQAVALSPSPIARPSARVTRSSTRFHGSPSTMRKAVSISSASEDSDQDFPSVEDVLTTTPKPRHRARNEEKQHSSNDEDSNNDLTTPRGSHLDKSRSLDAVRNLAQELFQTDKESNGSLEEVITPLRRKRLARRMSIDSPTPESSKRREDRDDHDEVMEDAAALEGNELRQNRTRGNARPTQRDARQKQLEIMKARRQRKAKAIETGELETTPDEDETNADSEVEDPSEDDWNVDQIRKSLRANSEENEPGFISDNDVEPEEGLDMPLEFTRSAYKKQKGYFKDVVEWMVHKKLNPAFEKTDEVYVIAFRKVNDEVRGIAGSKFVSSVWKENFQHALKARPCFDEVGESSHALSSGCEACGRSSHPATFRVRFYGKAYHPETLENLDDDDSQAEDDGDDDDGGSYDIDGNLLVSENHEFYIGRHCRSNASVAHALLHWRWQLNGWVLGWLEQQEYLTPRKIVERENWSIKRRSDYANRVVDEMEENELPNLHRDFRNVLNDARDKR